MQGITDRRCIWYRKIRHRWQVAFYTDHIHEYCFWNDDSITASKNNQAYQGLVFSSDVTRQIQNIIFNLLRRKIRCQNYFEYFSIQQLDLFIFYYSFISKRRSMGLRTMRKMCWQQHWSISISFKAVSYQNNEGILTVTASNGKKINWRVCSNPYHKKTMCVIKMEWSEATELHNMMESALYCRYFYLDERTILYCWRGYTFLHIMYKYFSAPKLSIFVFCWL